MESLNEVGCGHTLKQILHTYFVWESIAVWQTSSLSALDSVVLLHERLQEIRFQLDEHREQLKVKIDNIYMEMIDKTKEVEASYLKSFNDDIKVVLLFNLVIPDTFNVDINVAALFNLVVPDTFNIPEQETLPLSTVKTSAIVSGCIFDVIFLIQNLYLKFFH